MSDEEGISALKEIAKEQLDAQNASEEVYQVFYDYIENSYSENVNNFSARSKNVRMPREGKPSRKCILVACMQGLLGSN